MKNILRKLPILIRKINDDDIMPWASMLTLYLFLSIFPIIIVLTEVLSRTTLNNPELLSYWLELMPKSVNETINSIALELVGKQNTSVIPTAVIITLWSASRGMMAIISALNKAYNVKEYRSFIHLRLLAFFYTIGLMLLIVLTLVLIVFGSALINLIPDWLAIPDGLYALISTLRYGIPVLLGFVFFVSLYNACPTESIGFKKVLPGALLASIGLIGISILFSFYINHLTNLSYLYGSLTSVITLILWLFIVSVVIMVGGEVNAVFSSDFDAKNE